MNKLFAGLLTGLALVGYTSCSQSGYEVKVSYANPQEGKNPAKNLFINLNI